VWSDKNLVRLYKKYVAQHKLLVLSCLLVSILQSLLLLPSMYYIRVIFDQDIPKKDMMGLLLHSTVIIGFTLTQGFSTLITRSALLKIVKGTVQIVQRDLLKGLIDVERRFHLTSDGAKLANRVVDDVEKIDMMLYEIFLFILPQLILLAIGTVIMIVYNPFIGMMAMVVGATGWWLRRRLKRKHVQNIRENTEVKDNLAAYVNFIPFKQVLTKMKNAEEMEEEESVRHSDQVVSAGTKTATTGWQIQLTDELIVNIAATILIALGSVQILMGTSTYGDIFGLYFLIIFIRRTVAIIQISWGNVHKGRVSLTRVFELQDRLPLATEIKPGIQIDFNGNIQFKQVSFGYDERMLLRLCDFEITHGEVVCLSGRNAAGKSSMINLLLGFYKPSSGEIAADGVSYSQLDVGHLRSQIGFVPQHQIVFTGTVEANLTYGIDSKVQQERIDKWAHSKIGKQLLTGFHDGLQTMIVANGRNLSNGQVQRISLLRALMGEPKLLILDEPLNHLDSEAIVAIIHEIKTQLKIAALVVSHHPIFQEFADRVYELRNGILTQMTYENQSKSSE